MEPKPDWCSSRARERGWARVDKLSETKRYIIILDTHSRHKCGVKGLFSSAMACTHAGTTIGHVAVYNSQTSASLTAVAAFSTCISIATAIILFNLQLASLLLTTAMNVALRHIGGDKGTRRTRLSRTQMEEIHPPRNYQQASANVCRAGLDSHSHAPDSCVVLRPVHLSNSGAETTTHSSSTKLCLYKWCIM